jgi:8-oxo-dGTP pyrophosphatase MutT (NUDIX family)
VLDLNPNRTAIAPASDAATVVLVRDAPNTPHGRGIEIFFVERNKSNRFVGGALVFPGGKLEANDASEAWLDYITLPRPAQASLVPFARDEAHFRALAIAAARETLEEAAILLAVSRAGANAEPARAIADADILALRSLLRTNANALTAFLSQHDVLLDLASLHPLGRWVTPTSEPRRFDTRFFVASVPQGQCGAHDEHETVASFWASPQEALRKFNAGEVTLVPPTHRTLLVLASCTTTDEAIALAQSSSLDPICPKLVAQDKGTPHETLALVLPGDPEHDVKQARVAGPSRYVLRRGLWLAEHAPPLSI